MPARRTLLATLVAALSLAACRGDEPARSTGPAAEQIIIEERAAVSPGADADAPPALSDELAHIFEPRHTGFDDMVDRRLIRVVTTYSRTNYFLDGARTRGIVADIMQELEKTLNKELKLGRRRPLHVAVIPVLREQLIPYLEEGRADMAVAGLTITEARSARVDFSVPAHSGVSELVVTGPASPSLATVDDLAGQSVHVRRSSSYWESLEALNASFRERGLAPVRLVAASEYLETEDLLEMVAAGLVPIAVADDYLARFWAKVLPKITVHEKIAIGTGRDIGWAIRADAKGLKGPIDRFVRANRTGRLLGNMLIRRYFKRTDYVKNALANEDRKRFEGMVELFRQYGDRYDFDYLLMAAQGYQESGLDQSVRSRAGAVGVMQLLPSTAADPAVGIADIDVLENNIHAGAKYMRHLVDVYFEDPELDELNRMLFAFAGYNAGPNRIRRLRNKAAKMGYDRDQWFRNVEVVAAADVGREPVQYVRNIYKYYVAYRLLRQQQEGREKAIQRHAALR